MSEKRLIFNEFRREYDIVFLQATDEHIKLGQKVEYNSISGILNDIKNVYITDYLEIDSNIEDYYLNKFNEENIKVAVNAGLTAVDFENSSEFGIEFKIPSINFEPKIRNIFSKILKISFENVTVKEISDDLSRELFKKVNEIKDSDIRCYNRFNQYWFVQKLYFADTVNFLMDKSFENEIKLSLEKLKIDFNFTFKNDKESNVTIKNKPNVPFAVKLEQIKKLIK